MANPHRIAPEGSIAATPMLRWHASVLYRTDDGEREIEHRFEELDDLQDIIERGWDWNTIISIKITLARNTTPGLTVEQSVRI